MYRILKYVWANGQKGTFLTSSVVAECSTAKDAVQTCASLSRMLADSLTCFSIDASTDGAQ